MEPLESTEPSGDPWVRAAALLLVAYGVLVLLNAVVLWLSGDWAAAGDLSFGVLLLVVVGITGAALRRGQTWAWWLALLLDIAGLFFVFPVVASIILGAGTDPVGTGWDVVFFPTVALVLGALAALLFRIRDTVWGGPGSGGPSREPPSP